MKKNYAAFPIQMDVKCNGVFIGADERLTRSLYWANGCGGGNYAVGNVLGLLFGVPKTI
jgi:hypothetical protein